MPIEINDTAECDVTGKHLHATANSTVSAGLSSASVVIKRGSGLAVDVTENSAGGFSGTVTSTTDGVSLKVPVTEHSGPTGAVGLAKGLLKTCHSKVDGAEKDFANLKDLPITKAGKMTLPHP